MKSGTLKAAIILLSFYGCASPTIKTDVYQNSSPASFVDSITVNYKCVNDSALTLNMFTLKGDTLKNRSALVYIHGGGWVHGNKSWIWKHYRQAVAESFIKAGYAVFSVDYRLANGSNYYVGTELEDCRDVLYWIRDNADTLGIDAQRIGIWGTSAGAHLSLLLGNQLSDSIPIRYVIDDYGPTEIDKLLHTWVPNFAISATKLFNPQLIQRRKTTLDAFNGETTNLSPINAINKNMPPVLITHGGSDNTVPLRQATLLTNKLDEKGIHYNFLVYEGEDHVLGTLTRSQVESQAKRAVSFADSCNLAR